MSDAHASHEAVELKDLGAKGETRGPNENGGMIKGEGGMVLGDGKNASTSDIICGGMMTEERIAALKSTDVICGGMRQRAVKAAANSGTRGMAAGAEKGALELAEKGSAALLSPTFLLYTVAGAGAVLGGYYLYKKFFQAAPQVVTAEKT